MLWGGHKGLVGFGGSTCRFGVWDAGFSVKVSC